MTYFIKFSAFIFIFIPDLPEISSPFKLQLILSGKMVIKSGDSPDTIKKVLQQKIFIG